MLDRLLASIVKEAIMFWRDPRTRRMLLGMPVVQVLIFGFAASMEVRNADLAIINRDAGYWSEDLVSRISAAQFVGSVTRFASTEAMAEQLEARHVLLALSIPPDFSRKVVAGEPAELQLLVDGRRANAGQVASSYIGAIVAEWEREHGLNGVSATPLPQAAVRHWFNPNLDYRWFIVPSLAATMSMMIALMMTGLSIARERELGTFDQLLVSPSTPFEIMLSKTVPALVGAGIVGSVIVCLAVFGFGIPFQGNVVLLMAALLPYTFSLVGIGLVLSSLANTQQQAMLAIFFVFLPVVLTSGFATPVENMPEWLQFCAAANPLKYMLVIVHGSFLKSMTGADIWHNVWPLLIIGLVTFSAATLVVRRRLQ